MILGAFLVAATMMAEPLAAVTAVRLDTTGPRPALRIECSGRGAGESVEREGDEVVIRVGLPIAGPVAAPNARGLIEAVRVTRDEGVVVVRVRVLPSVPFEVDRREACLSVLFGERVPNELAAAADGEEPSGADGASEGDAPSILALAPGPDATDRPSGVPSQESPAPLVNPALLFRGASAGAVLGLSADDYTRLFPGRDLAREPAVQGGLAARREPLAVQVSFFSLRPSLVVSWIDSETILLDTNRVVRDRFLQIQPGLGSGNALAVGVSALDGRLRLGYEPRFRLLSDYALGTTHVADAIVDLPVGTRAKTLAAYRYFDGILETTMADPGREYFFNLGRYQRHQVTLGAKYEIGPRLGFDGTFDWSKVSFAEEADFFPYQTSSLRVGLDYDITPERRAFLRLGHQSTPASPERPVIASTSNEVALAVEGSLGLMNGEADLAFRDLTAPDAGPGGTKLRGLVGRGRLSREIFAETRLEFFLERAPWLSAWEDNAFYVANMAHLRATTPLPWSFYGTALGAWQRNSYKTTTPSLGRPRQDELLGWAVGVGRTLTRRAFFRVDYRKDYRDSNVAGYSIDTRSFVVQLGIGVFGEIGAEGRIRGGVGGGSWR